MINRIIEEINVCINSNCFLAALSTALTLPDICGKAEYGDMGNKKRYIQWFNEYIGKNEKHPDDSEEMPYMSGEIIYSLRNNTLHEGSFNINGKKCHIQDFELLVQDPNSARTLVSNAEVEYLKNEDGNEVQGARYLCINIINLILKICNAAKYYYKKNKAKFEFMDNKIVTIDRQTKRNFGLQEGFQDHEYFSYREGFTLDNKKSKIYGIWADN